MAGDPMVADYLLHAGERSHSIADLANRYLHRQVTPITDLIGKKGKQQLRLDQVTAAKVAEYSGEDADLGWQLAGQLETQLTADGLKDLYDNLEIPLIEVLAELEHNGIRVDLPRLEVLRQEMAQQLEAMEAGIHQLAGRAFNIASPQQLRKVLFDELKLDTQHKTAISREYSTDQEALEKLAAKGHQIAIAIIEYRQIAKLKGTYVDALSRLSEPCNRPHPCFFQSDGGCDGAPIVQRSEFAEYPGSPGTGAANPPGVLAGGRLGFADCRLLADRVAAARPFFRR